METASAQNAPGLFWLQLEGKAQRRSRGQTLKKIQETSPDEVGSGAGLRLGRLDAHSLPGFDAPEHPGHVGSQVSHGLQAFRVLQNILRLFPMYHRPVGGVYHRPLGDGELFLQHIPCSGGAGPPG